MHGNLSPSLSFRVVRFSRSLLGETFSVELIVSFDMREEKKKGGGRD